MHYSDAIRRTAGRVCVDPIRARVSTQVFVFEYVCARVIVCPIVAACVDIIISIVVFQITILRLYSLAHTRRHDF